MCDVFLCSADDILGTHRGGSATADGNGAIAAAGSNIHIEVGKSAAPGEMPSCKKCPHLKKLKELQKMIDGAVKYFRDRFGFGIIPSQHNRRQRWQNG